MLSRTLCSARFQKRRLVKLVSILGLIMVLFSVPSFAVAGEPGKAFKSAQKLLQQSAGETVGKGAAEVTPGQIVGTFVNAAVGVLGVVAVILLVYGGGLWLTAAGSPEKVAKAKKVIISTIIGVIIVGLAYAITSFILGQVVGTPTPAEPLPPPK